MDLTKKSRVSFLKAKKDSNESLTKIKKASSKPMDINYEYFGEQHLKSFSSYSDRSLSSSNHESSGLIEDYYYHPVYVPTSPSLKRLYSHWTSKGLFPTQLWAEDTEFEFLEDNLSKKKEEKIGDSEEALKDVKEEEKEEEEEEEEESYYSEGSEIKETSTKPSGGSQEPQRKSLFMHSSPINFPDVKNYNKSAFGSIFVRSTGVLTEDAALLRTIAKSSYNILKSLLSSLDKILQSEASDMEREEALLAYKESIWRSLETHGIGKTSSDGSVTWDIYPIAQCNLFSVEVGDRIHQTRDLTAIEERIVKGPLEKLGKSYEWPTKSVWIGHWDGLGMAGEGTYLMPHGVKYEGKMKDGKFHDNNATLTYPKKFTAIHCIFDNGKLVDCQFRFADMLLHEKENWGHCKRPDRRFWSEVRKGLKPAKIAQSTEIDPPRKIPPGCYDSGDGFYDAKSLMLTSPSGELLRVPVCEEEEWIKKYCRKATPDTTGFRPDLYENWFNDDQELINEILNKQDLYRNKKITYDELQQFYCNNNLATTSLMYTKKMASSETADFIKNIPSPIILRKPKPVKKYKGHKISNTLGNLSNDIMTPRTWSRCIKKHKVYPWPEGKHHFFEPSGVVPRVSKISFKLSDEILKSGELEGEYVKERSEADSELVIKKIPDRFLKPQPIIRPPFKTGSMAELVDSKERRKPCKRKDSLVFFDKDSTSFTSAEFETISKKRLHKFMKSLISNIIKKIVSEEMMKYKQRAKWASHVPTASRAKAKTEAKCMKILEELYHSIPEKEEFCDSDPKNTCDLKKLAEDKYEVLKYWGKRMFMLDFGSPQN